MPPLFVADARAGRMAANASWVDGESMACYRLIRSSDLAFGRFRILLAYHPTLSVFRTPKAVTQDWMSRTGVPSSVALPLKWSLPVSRRSNFTSACWAGPAPVPQRRHEPDDAVRDIHSRSV